MRSQILMLRALGEAYKEKSALATGQGQPDISLSLLFHGFAHLTAADALEAQHKAEIKAINDAVGVAIEAGLQAGVASLSCTCQGGEHQQDVALRANDCPLHGLEEEGAGS